MSPRACPAGALWALLCACVAKAPPPPPAAPPGPTETFEFVSTSHNEDAARPNPRILDDDEAALERVSGEFAVTSPERAREIAEAAVSDRLDPGRAWNTSPTLPSVWPLKGKDVAFLFYPSARDSLSLTHEQLYSAAFRVTVSLVDGSTAVTPLKSRKLGKIVSKRPSMLERNELAIAERSLLRMILIGDTHTGEDNFWGYLKYLHEHPELGRDIKGRLPSFVSWLHDYKKRGRG